MSASAIVRKFIGGLVHDIRADATDRWRIVAVVAGISAISMFDGFVRLMGGWSAAGPIGIFMAAAMSIVLQAVLVTAVNAWLCQRDQVGLRVYLACALVSSTVAMGFWYEHLGLNQRHAGEIYRHALEQNLDRLRSLDHSYQNFATTSLRLASHSAERAQVESARGGTCDVPQAGPGARMKYRANDAQILNDYGKYFGEKRETLKKIVRDAEALHGVRVDGAQIIRLREIISQANALAGDPRIGQVKAWLNQRVAEGRNGVIYGREFFRCRDSILEENARALTQITLSAMPMPEVPDPSRAGSNIIESFGVAFAALTLRWGEISFSQWVAFVIGLLVDAALYFLVRSMHVGRNPFDGVDLDGLATGQPSPALGLLLTRAVRRGGSYAIFIAHRDEQLRRLLWALERAGLAKYRGSRPLWWVPSRVRPLLSTDKNVEMYTLPTRAFFVLAIEPSTAGNRESGLPVDDRTLPAVVTPIGNLHGTFNRKNHEVLNG